MPSPESANSDLIERFVRRHMDAFLTAQPAFTDIPADMQQLLCRIVGEVVVMTDQDAEAASVAYDPNLTYQYYRDHTPRILRSNAQSWEEDARSELRMGLSATRFRHELPIFLPHHAEADYESNEVFRSAAWIARPVTARCLFGLEAIKID